MKFTLFFTILFSFLFSSCLRVPPPVVSSKKVVIKNNKYIKKSWKQLIVEQREREAKSLEMVKRRSSLDLLFFASAGFNAKTTYIDFSEQGVSRNPSVKMIVHTQLKGNRKSSAIVDVDSSTIFYPNKKPSDFLNITKRDLFYWFGTMLIDDQTREAVFLFDMVFNGEDDNEVYAMSVVGVESPKMDVCGLVYDTPGGGLYRKVILKSDGNIDLEHSSVSSGKTYRVGVMDKLEETKVCIITAEKKKYCGTLYYLNLDKSLTVPYTKENEWCKGVEI